MPTKNTTNGSQRFKTLIEDPNTGEHISIVTLVKYPGLTPSIRAREIFDEVDKVHKTINDLDQTSMNLKNDEGEE